MMIQLLLSIGLVLVVVYASVQQTGLQVLRSGIRVLGIVGLALVWAPDWANALAHALGVGRGADLITYLWILLSFSIAVNLHVKLAQIQRTVTELSRWLALRHVVPPEGADRRDPRRDQP